MKKVIMSAIMAVALIASTTVMAQDKTRKETKAKTESCCKKGDKKDSDKKACSKEKADKKSCCTKDKK